MAAYKTIPDARYTQTDEWVRMDGDEAVIGVTDYAQNALSNVTYVELPKVGQTFKAGDQFGTVESVKAASDVHLPIGGTVTAINSPLVQNPEVVNDDPYQTGWFIRIKPGSATELDSLMDAAAYDAFCATRG